MKTSISVELVPRDAESVLAEAAIVAGYLQVTHINIPDLERFALRSVEAIRLIRDRFGSRFIYVPHIRTVASTLIPESFPGDIALIVQGDIPDQFHTSPVPYASEHIASVSDKVRVMAGIDPYRSSLEHEQVVIRNKIAAGVVGFFTQPFFSLEHLRYWDTILPKDVEIFYGLSPVTTTASLAYWKEKNHVVFPNNFVPTVARQVAFARKVMRWATARNRSLYLMPIRMPLQEYLKRVFA